MLAERTFIEESSSSTAAPLPPLTADLVRVAWQLTPREGYAVTPHLHHYHQVDVVCSGRFAVRLEGCKPFELRRGDCLLVPPLVRHQYAARESVGHAVFKFHIPSGYWAVFGMRPLRCSVSAAVIEMVERWAGAGASRESRRILERHEITAIVTLLLVEIARHASPTARQASTSGPNGGDGLAGFRRHLWPVLERIGNDPCQPWSIAAMAQEANFSPTHFSRCFRKVVGQTPKHYLHAARMRAAASELVGEPVCPIKQVSRRAGYATVHAFTHAFKEFFGVSPGRYRKLPVTM